MKHEWRKAEKNIYLPKQIETIRLPRFKFITLKGEGDPNHPEFAQNVSALYAVAYDLRMSLKKGLLGAPYEYTVYPLEGVWTTSDGSKNETLNKNALVYQIMIRQPEAITEANVKESILRVQKKKPELPVEAVNYLEYEEGQAVQMVHIGPFDSELATFTKMEAYLKEHQLQRVNIMNDYIHREIYLSDPRRTVPEKLKTVLRYQVAPKSVGTR